MKKTLMPRRLGCLALAASLALTLNPASVFAAEVNVVNGDAPIKAYSGNVPARAMLNSGAPTVINVAAPLKLFFDGENGALDVNSAETEITARGAFINIGEPVRMTGIKTGSFESDDVNPFYSSDGMTLTIADPDTGTSATANVVNDTKSIDKDFVMPGYNYESDFDFSINISTANVKADKADNGLTAHPFGSVTYTFSSDIGYWMTDLRNPSKPFIYTLEEVKQHAIDIASGNDEPVRGSGDTPTKMYTDFATYPKLGTGEKNYATQVKLDLTALPEYATYSDAEKAGAQAFCGNYDLKVLGVNQDALYGVTQGEADKYGRTNAGITFMIDNATVGVAMNLEGEVQIHVPNNGWLDSSARKVMHFERNTMTDVGATAAYVAHASGFFSALYASMQGDRNLETVSKATGCSTIEKLPNGATDPRDPGIIDYTTHNEGKLVTSDDFFFPLSFGEIFGDVHNGYESMEGYYVGDRYFTPLDGLGADHDKAYMYYDSLGIDKTRTRLLRHAVCPYGDIEPDIIHSGSWIDDDGNHLLIHDTVWDSYKTLDQDTKDKLNLYRAPCIDAHAAGLDPDPNVVFYNKLRTQGGASSGHYISIYKGMDTHNANNLGATSTACAIYAFCL